MSPFTIDTPSPTHNYPTPPNSGGRHNARPRRASANSDSSDEDYPMSMQSSCDSINSSADTCHQKTQLHRPFLSRAQVSQVRHDPLSHFAFGGAAEQGIKSEPTYLPGVVESLNSQGSFAQSYLNGGGKQQQGQRVAPTHLPFGLDRAPQPHVYVDPSLMSRLTNSLPSSPLDFKNIKAQSQIPPPALHLPITETPTPAGGRSLPADLVQLAGSCGVQGFGPPAQGGLPHPDYEQKSNSRTDDCGHPGEHQSGVGMELMYKIPPKPQFSRCEEEVVERTKGTRGELDREEEEESNFLMRMNGSGDDLCSAALLAIRAIWGELERETENNSVPLGFFVREITRRSHISCSTLQLALWYMHKTRHVLRRTIARYQEKEKDTFSGSLSIDQREAQQTPPTSPTEGTLAVERLQEANPLLCGRRMLLAAMLTASKYLQDRNFSNRSWARLSGLDVKELNDIERKFLILIDFDLHIKPDDFRKWVRRLDMLERSRQHHNAKHTAFPQSQTRLPPHLTRHASEYPPARPQYQIQARSPEGPPAPRPIPPPFGRSSTEPSLAPAKGNDIIGPLPIPPRPPRRHQRTFPQPPPLSLTMTQVIPKTGKVQHKQAHLATTPPHSDEENVRPSSPGALVRDEGPVFGVPIQASPEVWTDGQVVSRTGHPIRPRLRTVQV